MFLEFHNVCGIIYYYVCHICLSEDEFLVPPCSFVSSMTLTVEENDLKNGNLVPHCHTQLTQKTGFTKLLALLSEHSVAFFYLNGILVCYITILCYFITSLRYFGRENFCN